MTPESMMQIRIGSICSTVKRISPKGQVELIVGYLHGSDNFHRWELGVGNFYNVLISRLLLVCPQSVYAAIGLRAIGGA